MARILRLALAPLVVCWGADNAFGQTAPASAPAPAAPASQFRVLNVTAPPEAAVVVRNAQRTGQVSDEAAFKKYYQAVIADFTVAEKWDDLAAKRALLKKDLRTYGNQSVKQAHEVCTEVLFGTLSKTVGDSAYHPGARVNWALILGDLNSVEAPLQGAGAAVPLPQALPVLLDLVNDPAQHDAVRAAALVGTLRHAESGSSLPDATRTPLVDSMKKLITTPAPKTSDPKVHSWLQERAAEVLKKLGEEIPAATRPGAEGPPEDAPPDAPPAAPPATDAPPADAPPG